MYKSISFYAAFNKITGYGIHATEFCNALEKILPVYRNQPGGDVSITLIDSVGIQNISRRLPYPSLLMNAWESTEQPPWFLEKLQFFDGLLVPSEWQRACSIQQGIPEEFVHVVHEGINPDIFKPMERREDEGVFNFLHIGQFQPRKSTVEICQSFLKAFPKREDVRLLLAVDTNFPSDSYKNTKERLSAYQVDDPRIIPLSFTEHLEDEKLVKLLARTDAFVSCSRAEGWGMPICIAMACGIPTIVCDYSGSTEYAVDAVKVPIKKMIKPYGIYGNWPVPGEWADPDFDELIRAMQDTWARSTFHKEKALQTSEYIRTEFSWEKAAKKAASLIQELSVCQANFGSRPFEYPVPEGFGRLAPLRKVIFFIDCWPSSEVKMDTLRESIQQVQQLGYPVLVSSHYPLPADVIELCDFYLYEKQDIMSGEDKPTYWRKKLDGTVETKPCSLEYQGVAALNCARNAIDFCRGKYDWIYQMSADMEVDLQDWLSKVEASDKDLVFMPYEGRKDGFGGGLWAAKVTSADRVFPYLSSWVQYARMFPDERFVAEKWLYKYVMLHINPEDIGWIECDTRNRFDNVDRDIWPDDEFQCSFVGGPFLNIIGISNREYDVIWQNSSEGVAASNKQKAGTWSRPAITFYRDWSVKASLDGQTLFSHRMNLKDQNVLISFGSKALGDTVAWMPYVEEFRLKHGCKIYCSSWWNKIFDYPEINFVLPGDEVQDIYASYEVGCFDNQPEKNPQDWRTVPLQKVATEILGLEYAPLKAKLQAEHEYNRRHPHPYVCFSEFSTMQNKMWNREGAWQKTVDYLNSLGYACISVSTEPTQLQNVIAHNGQNIERTLTDLAGAEFYIGLNAGPSWLAYALDLPVLMITGVSREFNDFPMFARIEKIICEHHGCFNDTSIPIGRGFDWCEGKDKFVCTREITESMVIEQIDRLHAQLTLGEKKEATG